MADRPRGRRLQSQANNPEVISQRRMIIGHYEAHYTVSEISRELGLCRSTVSKWIRRYEEEGNVNTRPRSGRPRVTTGHQDAMLNAAATQAPFKTSLTLTRELNLPCSARTTRTRLLDAGLPSRVPAEKPNLSPQHKAEREMPGEVNMTEFWPEIKEEIKVEEEDVFPGVFTEDPIAIAQAEAPLPEDRRRPSLSDTVEKAPRIQAETTLKNRVAEDINKVRTRQDDESIPLLATAEAGNFGDEACPPIPPLDPLVIALINSGKHQEQVSQLIQEVTEAYKAKKAAWQAMEKYYRGLNK